MSELKVTVVEEPSQNGFTARQRMERFLKELRERVGEGFAHLQGHLRDVLPAAGFVLLSAPDYPLTRIEACTKAQRASLLPRLVVLDVGPTKLLERIVEPLAAVAAIDSLAMQEWQHSVQPWEGARGLRGRPEVAAVIGATCLELFMSENYRLLESDQHEGLAHLLVDYLAAYRRMYPNGHPSAVERREASVLAEWMRLTMTPKAMTGLEFLRRALVDLLRILERERWRDASAWRGHIDLVAQLMAGEPTRERVLPVTAAIRSAIRVDLGANIGFGNDFDRARDDVVARSELVDRAVLELPGYEPRIRGLLEQIEGELLASGREVDAARLRAALGAEALEPGEVRAIVAALDPDGSLSMSAREALARLRAELA